MESKKTLESKLHIQKKQKMTSKKKREFLDKKTNFICFICITKTSKHTKPCAEGGLGW